MESNISTRKVRVEKSWAGKSINGITILRPSAIQDGEKQNCFQHHLARMTDYRYRIKRARQRKTIRYQITTPSTRRYNFRGGPAIRVDGVRYYSTDTIFEAARNIGLPTTMPGKRHKIKKYRTYPPEAVDTLIRKLHSIKGGPFMVEFEAKSKFAVDGNKIYRGKEKNSDEDMNHCVTVIGSGCEKIITTKDGQTTTRDGTKYWIVENSWDFDEPYCRIDAQYIDSAYVVSV